jgi:hypothetical protein
MMTLRNCRIETDDEGIAWLTLDKADASANSLNAEMLQEAAEVLAALEKNPPRGLVIRSGKRSGFVAGADINEFTTLRSIEQAERLTKAGQSVIDRFEALPCLAPPRLAASPPCAAAALLGGWMTWPLQRSSVPPGACWRWRMGGCW